MQNNSMKKKFVLFLVNKKGYYCLASLISAGLKNNIGIVVSYKQINVREDYFLPIKAICESNNIVFLEKMEFNCNAEELLKRYFITGGIAIGWQYLLPLEWFEGVENKLIVFHDSLLPRYRGFAPTPTAIIKGDKELGVTALYATNEVDQGDIILQKKYEISDTEYMEDIIERQCEIYSEMLKRIILLCENNQLTSSSQDESKATYSVWRDLNDCAINWNLDSKAIIRLIRAVSFPYMGAYSFIGDKKIYIDRAEEVEDLVFEIRYPGKIWKITADGPIIICGNGMLKIKEARYDDGTKVVFKKLRNRFITNFYFR